MPRGSKPKTEVTRGDVLYVFAIVAVALPFGVLARSLRLEGGFMLGVGMAAIASEHIALFTRYPRAEDFSRTKLIGYCMIAAFVIANLAVMGARADQLAGK